MSNYCKDCGKKLTMGEICNCKNEEAKESFYFKDFAKNFFKAHNIPIIIYLIANAFFIYGVSAIIFPIVLTEFFDVYVDARFYIVLAAIIAVIYIVGLILSLSDIGEWILRRKNHCDEITDDEVLSRLEPLFLEVYNRALEQEPGLNRDIMLYIQEDEEPNAFAVGRKSVCVTTGLLEYSDEEIKAILGHEFGHLAHKDTDVNLIINAANWLINISFMIIWAFVFVIHLILKVIALISSIALGSGEGIFAKILDIIYSVVAFVCVLMFQKAWLILGNILVQTSSKGSEYLADEFSANLGYSSSLKEFFSKLDDANEGYNTPLKKTLNALASLGASHPATWKRIAALEKIEGEKITDLTASTVVFTDITEGVE